MDALIQWASSNVEWLFSGIGVTALTTLGIVLRRRSAGTKQIVKESANVTQIGGNFTMTRKDD